MQYYVCYPYSMLLNTKVSGHAFLVDENNQIAEQACIKHETHHLSI
jgi:hypothetical protein